MTGKVDVAIDKARGPVKMVRIMLDHNDKVPPGGQFFGINGKAYLLKAGVNARVPIGILDVLKNAVESTPVVNPDTMRIDYYVDKPRFAYQRIAEDVDG